MQFEATRTSREKQTVDFHYHWIRFDEHAKLASGRSPPSWAYSKQATHEFDPPTAEILSVKQWTTVTASIFKVGGIYLAICARLGREHQSARPFLTDTDRKLHEFGIVVQIDEPRDMCDIAVSVKEFA